MLIPDTPIVVAARFSSALPARRVAGAIARGLRSRRLPAPELCPLTADDSGAVAVRELLDAADFDTRIHRARAVILADAPLRLVGSRRLALIGTATFEIATRARQAGVPAYAVLGSALDSFDARILDLQVVLEAHDTKALTAAGRRLATLI